MSFDRRIGLAGLIMAVFAIAAPYLWPNNKWIGWLFFLGMIALGITWFCLE
jgi:hypothetical protein